MSGTLEDDKDEAFQISGQTRPVQKVISYLQTLDEGAYPARDSVRSRVVFDAPRSPNEVQSPLESLSNEAEQEAKLFSEALKAYEAEVPKRYKTGINIDQPHSITDVIRQIDLSLSEYKHDTEKKTLWQAIRKGFWRLSENHDGLESWLEVLTSTSEYTSLIYAGISLILKAAGRIGEVRNEAFKALTEIPHHLESTRTSVSTFDKSEPLRKCGIRLYTVTLDALGHILKWFKIKAFGKAFGALLKQQSYQRELILKIAEIHTVSTRFKTISMTCLEHGVANTEKLVDSIKIAVVAVENNQVIIKESLDRNNAEVNTLHEQVEQVRNGHEKQREDQLEYNKKVTDILNDFSKMYSKMESMIEALPFSESPPPAYHEGQERSTGLISSSKTLSVLENEVELSQVDLLCSLRGMGRMSRSDQDRAVWAMKSHMFCSWLSSTISSSLVINGSCSSTQAQSPLTFLCAHLIESFKSNSDFFTLHFFCGQHLSSVTDPNATPLGMINSMLAQLLILYSNFEISNDDLASISANAFSSVLRLFSNLVSQLPPTSKLLLIIDGISLYEDAARLPETRKVISGLNDITSREDGFLVKVLFTSSTRIKNLPDGLSKVEVLNLPRQVPSQTRLLKS